MVPIMIKRAKLRSGRLTGVMKRLLLGVRKLAIDFDLSQSQGTARLLPARCRKQGYGKFLQPAFLSNIE
jgi:hypothetical protein